MSKFTSHGEKIFMALRTIVWTVGLGVCGAAYLSAQCTGSAQTVVTVLSGTSSQQAIDCLETSGTVSVTGSSSITFEAGSAVYLEPGFSATGTSSTAFIALTAPDVITTDLGQAIVGGLYTAVLSAQEGASNGPFTWSATGLPSWLTLTGNTILGTPTAIGTATFSVAAADSVGHSSLSRSLTIAAKYGTTIGLSWTLSGGSYNLTANVTSTGSGTPTGTVTFYELGPTIISTTSTLSSGTAAATLTALSGGISFVAFYSGDSSNASSDTPPLSAGSTSQTITFSSLPGVAFGISPLTLSATASSHLLVSFTSTTPSVCTVSGNTVTLVAVGTCSITANQAGDTTYAAASPVTQGFAISQGSQTISFGPLSNQGISSSPPSLSATASSGLTVAFSSMTTSVCTVSGTAISLVTTGTCTIQANQSGNSNYSAASAVNQSFTVTTLSTQTITFVPLSSQYLGSSPPALSASASSGLTVAFTSNTTSICTVSGTNLSLAATGTCSVTASQAGNSTYAAAVPVTQTFAVEASCSGTHLREYIRMGGRVVAIENSCVSQ